MSQRAQQCDHAQTQPSRTPTGAQHLLGLRRVGPAHSRHGATQHYRALMRSTWRRACGASHTHACDRVRCDVMTSSPSLLMRFFSCAQGQRGRALDQQLGCMHAAGPAGKRAGGQAGGRAGGQASCGSHPQSTGPWPYAGEQRRSRAPQRSTAGGPRRGEWPHHAAHRLSDLVVQPSSCIQPQPHVHLGVDLHPGASGHVRCCIPHRQVQGGTGGVA